MKSLILAFLFLMTAGAFSACQPKRQLPPNYDQVRQNHEEAQQDLREEEKKKKENEE